MEKLNNDFRTELAAMVLQTSTSVEEMERTAQATASNMHQIRQAITDLSVAANQSQSMTTEIIQDISSKLLVLEPLAKLAEMQAKKSEDQLKLFSGISEMMRTTLGTVEAIHDILDLIHCYGINIKTIAARLQGSAKTHLEAIVTHSIDNQLKESQDKLSTMKHAIFDSLPHIQQLTKTAESSIRESIHISGEISKLNGKQQEIQVGLEGVQVYSNQAASNIQSIDARVTEVEQATAQNAAALTQIRDAMAQINNEIADTNLRVVA